MWRADDKTDLRVNPLTRKNGLKHLAAMRESLSVETVNEPAPVQKSRIREKLDLFSKLDSRTAIAARNAKKSLGVAA